LGMTHRPKPSDAVRCPSIVTEMTRDASGAMVPRFFVRGECVPRPCRACTPWAAADVPPHADLTFGRGAPRAARAPQMGTAGCVQAECGMSVARRPFDASEFCLPTAHTRASGANVWAAAQVSRQGRVLRVLRVPGPGHWRTQRSQGARSQPCGLSCAGDSWAATSSRACVCMRKRCSGPGQTPQSQQRRRNSHTRLCAHACMHASPVKQRRVGAVSGDQQEDSGPATRAR
jgi:hypothetical protein